MFRNKRAHRIKLLLWQRNGFWLLMKRPKANRFVLPREIADILELGVEQLHWLLAAMRKQPAQHYARVN
ncbi:MAG: IS66 family insertion sequence element accessory protein TnpB [Burkholderiales bacterium]|nr:IS66 family insertion sequence element accessory protein TnpB [Burkholderiales bacterium]